MSTSDPPHPKNETPAQPESGRRWSKRLAIGIVLIGLLVWQRGRLIGEPIKTMVAQRLMERRFEEAIWWNDLGHSINSADPDFAVNQARIARRQGQMDKVSDALKLASELGAPVKVLEREQTLALAQSGQLEQVQDQLSALLVDPDFDNTEVCEAFVLGYIRTARAPEAIPLLTGWISDEDTNPWPLLLRARCHKLMKLNQEAEDDFATVIKMAPKWNQAKLELGELLVELNRFDEAGTLLDGLVAEDNNTETDYSVRLRIVQAECLVADGNSARATELLRAACKLDASNLDAFVALGRCLLEDGKPKEAEQPLLAALKLREGYDETHYLLAQVYSQIGPPEKAKHHSDYVRNARDALTELDRLNAELATRKTAEALIRAGEIQLKYDDPRLGVMRILAALDMEPANPQALTLLADHYARLANHDASYETLAKEFQQRLKATQ